MAILPDHKDKKLPLTFLGAVLRVSRHILPHLGPEERECLKTDLRANLQADAEPEHDAHSIDHSRLAADTAILFAEKVDPDRNILLAICLFPQVRKGAISIEDVRARWGSDVADLIEGVNAVLAFSSRNAVVNQENFRGLLLSLAKDIRVIIIMAVHSLALMRTINHHPDEQWVRDVAFEADCIYAQLAHRLGLYAIKSELEDLALKYTRRDVYSQIAARLNETKAGRDKYIAEFIRPVAARLSEAGLKFDIKGRTKSISSIWAKILKQKVDLNGIYDLFAIRVIIDTPPERERSDCWLAYSIVANMYTANPARMKDWISIPKSNGYESLHATVMGPGNKWVEVQIRTRRMDLVAEKGLAAHWRYKGVKGDSADQWMNNVRDILESAESGPMELMRDMKADTFSKEVFAFTPKGDLFRLPAGSTVLDFAFLIHSNVGAHCTGGIVNGRHEKISHRISNGDTVEILTSAQQTPKQDWLKIVVSPKARNKIRQSLNESKQRRADLGKEMLDRRLRNRKLEIDEALIMRNIKKAGYKYATDFFADLSEEKIDLQKFIQSCIDAQPKTPDVTAAAAEEFKVNPADGADGSADVLSIGDGSVRSMQYSMARCCSPVCGDDVFGFISTDGMVKVHRSDCPNATELRRRYPYRLIAVQWNSCSNALKSVNLRVVGKDDIGIVTNITSIISKEKGMMLRNINIDSDDGLFAGVLTIGVTDASGIGALARKIRDVRGVKSVTRI